MVEGRGDGGRQMVGTEDRQSAGLGDFTVARKYLPALQFRSLGERLAQEVCARRGDCTPLRGRYHLGISIPDGRRTLPGESTGTVGKVWTGTPSRKDAPDRVRQVCRREPET